LVCAGFHAHFEYGEKLLKEKGAFLLYRPLSQAPIVLFSIQKVRLNFRIGCDFSTANHSPLHLFGQEDISRRTISPSVLSDSPRLFSKLLSNLTPQLMHLNSRTVLAIPVSPVSVVGQGLRVINQKGNQQYERGSN